MERKSIINRILIVISIILLIGVGVLIYDLYFDKEMEQKTEVVLPFSEPIIEESKQMPLTDNESIYAVEEDGKVVDVYVTVLPPEGSKYSTMDKIQAYAFEYDEMVEKPAAKIVFQVGDENGPKNGMLTVNQTVANGVLEPRGRSTSRSLYKSYKITLSDKSALWGGQNVLNLNFHPYDRSRVRNKLSFDFYEILPDVASLRTQFVRLHLKDNSTGVEGEFVEYGLFTHVEQVNKRYLKAHGLDADGSLYKANFFEFHRYFDVLKLVTDPDYDEDLFSQHLEIRGSKDHEKLLAMLDSVNDYSIDVDDLMDQYFNRDNYLTWLASNIIIGNSDTLSQNFFLYSPQAINNWYFIPWDCDGAWGYIFESEARSGIQLYSEWQYGIQNLWGSQLNNRFLRKKENVAQLDQKIEELMKIYTENNINKLLSVYYPEILKSQSTPEDLVKVRSSAEAFAQSYNSLSKIPKKNYQIYLNSKEKPMPFFQNDIEMIDGFAYISWGSSFDLQDDQLVYDLEISRTPDMTDLVHKNTGLTLTEDSVPLEKGTYYMKVIVRDSKGNSMIAFDTYSDLENNYYFGVKEVKAE